MFAIEIKNLTRRAKTILSLSRASRKVFGKFLTVCSSYPGEEAELKSSLAAAGIELVTKLRINF